jgi:hypothetical protein
MKEINMKKLLLCTLIMSLWTLDNVMPGLLKPENNPTVKALNIQISAKSLQIFNLKNKPKPLTKSQQEELFQLTNEYNTLKSERDEIYREYEENIKDD